MRRKLWIKNSKPAPYGPLYLSVSITVTVSLLQRLSIVSGRVQTTVWTFLLFLIFKLVQSSFLLFFILMVYLFVVYWIINHANLLRLDVTLRVGRGCDVSDGFTADVRPTPWCEQTPCRSETLRQRPQIRVLSVGGVSLLSCSVCGL